MDRDSAVRNLWKTGCPTWPKARRLACAHAESRAILGCLICRLFRDARDQRRLGPDDDEIDAEFGCKSGDGARVHRVNGMQLCKSPDPRVAGAACTSVTAGSRQGQRERVLTVLRCR